ncbi:MAG: hypothetical protein HC857_03210 [Synechococcales cyanobacterium RU_4_20]|nr:hypothetical protein [Synechococcales cyanobacterium RU_4_20]NJR70461.1 hypothetical protein [Synechococcales cyanobacterium CRU_2_2]
MLQNASVIRHYQKLTDSMVELWERGYRSDDLRLFIDGYLAALKVADTIEAFHIHRLEEETMRFLYDPANFEIPQPQPQRELERRYF